MRTSVMAAILVLTLGMALTIGQRINLRPGKYEITAEMESPERKMRPLKRSRCITAEEAKDVSKAFQDPEMEKECKVSDVKVVGSKLTMRTDCRQDDVQATGTIDVTLGADSYTALVLTKDNKGRTMTIKQTAKWIGECTK